jgi:hypothetical protein
MSKRHWVSGHEMQFSVQQWDVPAFSCLHGDEPLLSLKGMALH